jgi:hypothetical protein
MVPRLLPIQKTRSNHDPKPYQDLKTAKASSQHDPKPYQDLKTAKASSQTSELKLFELLKNRSPSLGLKIAEKVADRP